jgi:hypothetical protein
MAVDCRGYNFLMAKKEQDPFDEVGAEEFSDVDAAPGPRRRPRGGELPENEDLDSEGQPDLEGALPGKEITGDAQEGEVPPGDHWKDPDHRDTLDERLAEERPDFVRADVEEVRLLDEEAEGEGDEISEFGDEGGYPSAEEAAMHITRRPPGAVDKGIDSYTGDPVEDLDFREEP